MYIAYYMKYYVTITNDSNLLNQRCFLLECKQYLKQIEKDKSLVFFFQQNIKVHYLIKTITVKSYKQLKIVTNHHMTETVLPEHAKCQGGEMRKFNENCRRRYNLSDLFSYIQDLIFENKKYC